ncbi:hypothetical protein LTR64_000639 [Lithohypha guttulata]|uniref:uncharacterized protein n=1 Tax=Lithohypha guttulata TaxID=1690604 RepID=UPI002DDE2714|nr:hypothetical protein LTR51_005593 [Lithohypha guttulata]
MPTTTIKETATDPSQWTTPQELCLLQSVIHHKPVGIHKHFRMISILDLMLTSGTIPHPASDYPHCSTVEGIWRKLESLYDLKALDEREDAIFADVPDDSEDGTIEYWREFELKGDSIEQQMWDRRLAEGEEEWSENGDGSDVRKRESTVADSEDPRSSPVGSVRGRRTTISRRLAEVKHEDSLVGGSGKGSRRTSKAASPSIKDEEDTEMLDADQDEEEESSEDENESQQDETEDDNKKARTTRGRGAKRGRARRGRRGK